MCDAGNSHCRALKTGSDMTSQEWARVIIVSYCTDEEVRKRTDAGIGQQRYRTGRGGALGVADIHDEEGVGRGCILAAKVLQCQQIQRGVKEPSSAKQESGRIWVFHCSFNRAGGGGGGDKGTSASTVLDLVYWIWLWQVGKSGARGGKGMSLSCRALEDEEVLPWSSP